MKLFAGGKQVKSLVPLLDVARCFKFMEEKENINSEIFHLTKDTVTVNQVAEICKKHGILTIGIVTLPFTFEGDEDIEIARSAMELTQTLQFAQRNFNEISGGEKQRVVIAGAIAQEPELMILDEPTSALDIKYQIQILNILKRLNESKKTTVILAMHDLHLASKFCTRLILLEEGKIFKDGTTKEVLQKEHIEKVYGVKVHLIHDQDGNIMISPDTMCAQ